MMTKKKLITGALTVFFGVNAAVSSSASAFEIIADFQDSAPKTFFVDEG